MDKVQLIEEIFNGKTFRYYPFLKGPFSNWRAAKFTLDGIVYAHVEQYYMAQKAKYFNDFESYDNIMKTNDPKIVKRFGRNEHIKGFDLNVWSEVKYAIMLRGNLEKYRQNPRFAKMLLKTGDRILVECNPNDLEWSCGLNMEDTEIKNPLLWPGKNLLGFVLMEVRKELRKER